MKILKLRSAALLIILSQGVDAQINKEDPTHEEDSLELIDNVKLTDTLVARELDEPVVSRSALSGNGIIAKHIERSGGTENWEDLKSTMMEAYIEQQGMHIPINIYNTREGKQALIVDIEGKEFTQLAFNGEIFWVTNFQTQTVQKASKETSGNIMQGVNDFPSPLVNMVKNGYRAEYEGREIIDGAELLKVKITLKPLLINGIEMANETHYFFNTVSYMPIAVESTKPDGTNITIGMSDYREVGGLLFPFKLTQGGIPIIIEKITLNPYIDEQIFEFPEEENSKETSGRNGE